MNEHLLSINCFAFIFSEAINAAVAGVSNGDGALSEGLEFERVE